MLPGSIPGTEKLRSYGTLERPRQGVGEDTEGAVYPGDTGMESGDTPVSRNSQWQRGSGSLTNGQAAHLTGSGKLCDEYADWQILNKGTDEELVSIDALPGIQLV